MYLLLLNQCLLIEVENALFRLNHLDLVLYELELQKA